VNYLETLLQSAQEESRRLQARLLEYEKAFVFLSNPQIAKWIVDYNPENNPFVQIQIDLALQAQRTPKPLVFSEEDNTPCTAAIEVKIERLIAYFNKRAKENERRATKEESQKEELRVDSMEEFVQKDRTSYYLSGKADSYRRAAEKVKEFLG
jgi:hypothetical protein